MLISERILKIIKKKNITQAEFAKRAGIASSTVSEWKKKKTNPSADKIMDICVALEVTPEELSYVQQLFNCFGKAEIVTENMMDAVIGVAGSSPAYVYIFMEALADGAVKFGIPRAQAYEMVAQTMIGAAKMLLETGEHPGKLKDNVCSPGGTTIAAVAALEEAGFRNAVIKACDACYEKATSMKK